MRNLVLPQLDIPCFVDMHVGGGCPLLNRTREVNWGNRVKMGGRKGGEEGGKIALKIENQLKNLI